jgi:hypothetical protein
LVDIPPRADSIGMKKLLRYVTPTKKIITVQTSCCYDESTNAF